MLKMVMTTPPSPKSTNILAFVLAWKKKLPLCWRKCAERHSKHILLSTEALATFFLFFYFLCNSWLVASTTVASSVAYGAQHMQNGSLSTTKILRSVSKNKPHWSEVNHSNHRSRSKNDGWSSKIQSVCHQTWGHLGNDGSSLIKEVPKSWNLKKG